MVCVMLGSAQLNASRDVAAIFLLPLREKVARRSRDG